MQDSKMEVYAGEAMNMEDKGECLTTSVTMFAMLIRDTPVELKTLTQSGISLNTMVTKKIYSTSSSVQVKEYINHQIAQTREGTIPGTCACKLVIVRALLTILKLVAFSVSTTISLTRIKWKNLT